MADESLEKPVTGSAPRDRHPPHRDPVLPFLLFVSGLALIALAGYIDARHIGRQTWATALLMFDEPENRAVQTEGDVFEVSVREVPLSNFPEEQKILNELKQAPHGPQLVTQLRLDTRERIVYASLPAETLEELPATGTLPEPGKQEVLAGDLARLDSFKLDGIEFEAVGRLERGVAGLSFGYVLPRHPRFDRLFTERAGAKRGVFDPDGLEDIAGERSGPRDADLPFLIAARASPVVIWLTFAGLVMTVTGGAWAVVYILRRVAQRRMSGVFIVLSPLIDEAERRPRLFAFLHAAFFGLLFAAMIAAVDRPIANARMTGFVSHEFTEGGLSYIGEAYESENIGRAALATFRHNYLVATVLYSVIPSLVIPFAGALKNAASFAAAGFVMAPIWAGRAGPMLYHSVTMAVELEAYVLAVFGICALPLRMWSGLQGGRFIREWARGLGVLISATIVSGVILAIAAVYEAATLITLR